MIDKDLSERAEGEIRRWVAEEEKRKRAAAEPAPKAASPAPAANFNIAAPKETCVKEQPAQRFFQQLGARLDKGLTKLGL